jgi:hypothetical protein
MADRRHTAEASVSGARYEIAIDGTTLVHGDSDQAARATAMNLKRLNPNSEITLRDLQTGAVTKIEHPSSR